MLGLGPIIWQRIGELTGVNCGEQTLSLAPGKRFTDGRKDYRYYSGRYYRAIDTIMRGDRRLTGHPAGWPSQRVFMKPFP